MNNKYIFVGGTMGTYNAFRMPFPGDAYIFVFGILTILIHAFPDDEWYVFFVRPVLPTQLNIISRRIYFFMQHRADIWPWVEVICHKMKCVTKICRHWRVENFQYIQPVTTFRCKWRNFHYYINFFSDYSQRINGVRITSLLHQNDVDTGEEHFIGGWG